MTLIWQYKAFCWTNHKHSIKLVKTGTFRSNWHLPSKVNNTQMLTRFTSIHLAWHTFRRMVNWGIQHNISTILCLCISFGSIFLLCSGCFGKCVFLFVGTVSKFALYKGFDISAEFILFATHYITLVESPSSTQSLQFHHLRWWNWQTDSFYSFVFTWTNNISQGNNFYFWFKLNRAGRTFLSFIFSAECTIGMVRGLTPLKHYDNEV